MKYYLQLYSGTMYDSINPNIEDIHIEDIAWSLSHLCRFNGHTRTFYSVAQHAVIVSQNVPKEHALAALMHDGGEAYLSDLPRVVKRGIPEELLKKFTEIENRNLKLIAEKFGFKFPLSPEVKHADDRVLAAEMRDLMHHRVPIVKEGTKTVTTRIIAIRDTICPVGPEEAYKMFMDRFNELTDTENPS